MGGEKVSKYPLPSEASDFRFLISDSAPGHAVLEFDTPSNPVRVFLSKEQLKRLVREAGITAAKMDSRDRISGLPE